MPVLSVIVPLYNSEKTIANTLNSIIKQTIDGIEIIVVDDGSTDSSVQIVEEMRREYNFINIIQQKNQGPSVARNTGIRYANGEYIAFVDSDDWIEPKMYEEMINCINRNNADCVICEYFLSKEKENILIELPFKDNQLLKNKEIINDLIYGMISGKIMGSVCRVLYRRKIIINNEIYFNYQIKYMEDILFNISYFMKISTLAVCKKPLYFYCFNESSLTNKYFNDYFNNMYNVMNEIESKIDNLNDRITVALNNRKRKIIITAIQNEMKKYKTEKYCKVKNDIKKILEHPYVKTFKEFKNSYSFKERILNTVIGYKFTFLVYLIIKRG